MRNKNLFLILFLAVLMLMVSMVSVSAQNVDNMSNEELTTLLLQIMQKLEQSEEETETPKPTPTPTPAPELSDDKAELEALLTAIMQKLQQEENAGTATQKPAGTMVPVNDEPENEIWENKKLIIEGLPSYMFIQPTQPVKPEPDGGGNPGGGNPGGGNPPSDPPSRSCDGRPPRCNDGTLSQCVCDVYGNCYWSCAKG